MTKHAQTDETEVVDGERLSSDLVARTRGLTDDEIAAFSQASLADIFDTSALSTEVFGVTPLEKEKDALIGTPFAILQWRFNPGAFDFFVSITIKTEDAIKVVNDGSTGIYAQLEKITERLGIGVRPGLTVIPPAPIACRNGVHKSEYWYEVNEYGDPVRDEDTGRLNIHKIKPDGISTQPGATYYLQ